MGSEGGNETLRKYGRKHFSEIGKRGFLSFANKYFAGNKDEAISYLHLQAAERRIDALVSEKLGSGEETCVEMPVILSPDDDPTFQEPPSWRERVKALRREQEVDLPF